MLDSCLLYNSGIVNYMSHKGKELLLLYLNLYYMPFLTCCSVRISELDNSPIGIVSIGTCSVALSSVRMLAIALGAVTIRALSVFHRRITIIISTRIRSETTRICSTISVPITISSIGICPIRFCRILISRDIFTNDCRSIRHSIV